MSYLSYMITEEDDGRQVLYILRFRLGLSTGKIRSVKWDEEGILLNEVRVTVRATVHAGQLLKVLMNDSPKKEDRIIPCRMDLDILYEDDDLLIVNKPPGLVCHPSKGHLTDTLSNGVAAHFMDKNERSCVHLLGRLDKDTSGILCIAKNGVSAQRLNDARKHQRKGRIEKEYLAIAEGHIKEACGEIHIPMKACRDPSDGLLKMYRTADTDKGQAATFYEVLGHTSQFSLCRVKIETGKMHQIRFHMSSIGHPLAGDPIYGHGPDGYMSRTALHAYQLRLCHPISGQEISIRADLPDDMQACLSRDGKMIIYQ